MTDALSTALNGLQKASVRANAAASNIAGALVSGAREGTQGPAPYIPVDVVETSDKAQTIARNPATVEAYQPEAPFADEQGMVAMPNVDDATEIVNLRQAALAYKANAKVVGTAADMQDELLNAVDEKA